MRNASKERRPVDWLICGLLDLFFPRFCAVCRIPIRERDHPCLCEGCEQAIATPDTPVCPKCARALGPHVAVRSRCLSCDGKSLFFHRAHATGRYDGVLKTLIHQFKYAGRRHLLPYLLARMERLVTDVLGDTCGEWMLVPVPPDQGRRRAECVLSVGLAEGLVRRTGFQNGLDVLVKIRSTAPQSSLRRVERWKNLGGCFQIRDDQRVAGRRVVLVDDVLTTGATAAACSRALKKAGAEKILVMVLAR